MSPSLLAPQQHNQPSRKSKKAWRKNVDITEVQDGLESARDEATLGGIVAELPSDALFVQDSTGSVAIQKAYNKINKPLKSEEILAQRSAVPAVDSRKRKNNIGDGILPIKRRKEGGISYKELDRLRRLAYGGDTVHKDVVKADGIAAEDLWNVPDEGTEPISATPGEDQFSFLEKKKPVRAPATLKHASISLLANGKTIPAIPKPAEGKSYNPSFEAWGALIQSHGEEEVARERQRLESARAETELADRVAKSAEEARLADEEDQSEWESEWEGFVSEREEAEEENAAWLNKKRPERKTQAERNKIQRRKEEERRKKAEEKLKERERQLQRIKALAQEAEAKKKSMASSLVAHTEGSSEDEIDGQTQVLRRKRLGKTVLPEAPLELVLADELQDSLRALKPEGNLLHDRFRSMQVRGKIETRKAVWQSKKANRKATEKWSYKDWKLKY
ncbi:P60-like protein [Rhizodiscina lignyota]|uniref:Ribosome biogenesis protein NOP53 n=1 Tax=Rhizodiscina lignyota TaxID=1504668 RepID=A0A9P4MFI1_9PEZI|nr:P60-like protein [Rhizodiscina lignyota]